MTDEEFEERLNFCRKIESTPQIDEAIGLIDELNNRVKAMMRVTDQTADSLAKIEKLLAI